MAALAALLLALGLAACTNGDSDDSSTDESHLRVLLAAPVANLDPITGARTGPVIWATIIEPLIALDAELQPTQDGLITDWVQSTPTTWDLTVREGVEFTNGEPADAEAVANTLMLTRNMEGSALAPFYQNLASATAVDSHTVQVTTELPQATLPEFLTTIYLVPPEYYEEVGPQGYSAEPIGTGPFMYDSAQAGRSFSVKRNPDYWGEPAQSERITFTWSTEPSQRLALLQTGEVDVAWDLPPEQVTQADAAGLPVVTAPSTAKVHGILQANTEPFTDPSLREAAALAVDRDAIVSGIFGGQAIPDGGMLNIFEDEPSQVVEADMDRAKELVGDRSPEVLLSWPSQSYINIDEVAQAVGNSLTEAGFDVQYNPQEYATLFGQVVAGNLDGFFLIRGVPDAPTPGYVTDAYFRTNSLTRNCPDPEMDTLADEAMTAPSVEESMALYDDLNTLGVVENNCYIPLYRQYFSYATAQDVEGVTYVPLGSQADWTGARRG